jgi:hypothetical protein
MSPCAGELSRHKSSLERSIFFMVPTQEKKTKFPTQTTLDGVVRSLLISAVITEVRMGEMSKLG